MGKTDSQTMSITGGINPIRKGTEAIREHGPIFEHTLCFPDRINTEFVREVAGRMTLTGETVSVFEGTLAY